ncbi:MAG: D-alanine--D-alanine ligase [Mariprofundales bacterium]|nr:D-alanine--D-alanine ligase [Mariprofundales bacterium]
MRVALLMGGSSAERAISLRSGEAVSGALRRRGYDVVALDLSADRDWAAMISSAAVDAVFIALHGTLGEDGAIQGMLEVMRIPYTGSSVMASAICMDKRMCKRVLNSHDVATPVDIPLDSQGAPVRYPVLVKPVAQGSSVGVRLVRSVGEMPVDFTADGWLVEMPVVGVEVAVSVLSGEALPVIEVRPAHGLYDYAAKYELATTEYICPAALPVESQRLCMEQAERVVALLGCSGAARVDMIVADGGEAVVLEVNTIPGMTATSLLPKAAAVAGIDFDLLCERLVQGAALHV